MNGASVAELECGNVTVRYGDVVALRGVSVAFEPRRIHAVVGQNGAGKTTFARVCAGIVRPDSGELRIAGQEVPTGSVNQARAAGVELVHQSFALPPSFTVAEAMEFGSKKPGGAVYSRRGLERRWAPHLESLGINVRLGERIRDLPIETQQAIEKRKWYDASKSGPLSDDELEDFLTNYDWLIKIAVIKDDGWPYVVPVWYLWEDGAFWAVGRKRSEWVHDLIREPRCAICIEEREIPPAALSSEEFIVREEGSGTRAAMEQFFHDHHIDPPRIMEMTSNETIKQAVIANMGLAFLSLHTAALEVDDDGLVRQYGKLWRAE